MFNSFWVSYPETIRDLQYLFFGNVNNKMLIKTISHFKIEFAMKIIQNI